MDLHILLHDTQVSSTFTFFHTGVIVFRAFLPRHIFDVISDIRGTFRYIIIDFHLFMLKNFHIYYSVISFILS